MGKELGAGWGEQEGIQRGGETRASFLPSTTNTQMHELHKSARNPVIFYCTKVDTSTSATAQFRA